MKENEFDILVRQMMQDAEETVSPSVWEGVSAGLDRAARKRVVPMWIWRGMAGVAVAAAALTGIVLLRPGTGISNQPIIQQATLAETAPVLQEPGTEDGGTVAPIEQQVSRLQGRTAYVPETSLVQDVPAEEKPDETPVPAERTETTVAPPALQDAEPAAYDEEAFNRLAFEDRQAAVRRRFSLTVNGNLQGNNRPESPSQAIHRAAPLRAAPTATTLRENPEFSFGLPVSAGIGLRYDFTPRWGIGTGIVYTNLSRSFVGTYIDVDRNGKITLTEPDTDVDDQQHYLGIPLNLYYNVAATPRWNAHVFVGGTFEKLVDDHYLIHGETGNIHYHKSASGLQSSIGIGIGSEYRITPYLGIYLDPSLRYYFDCNQPRSIRTIQPLRFDFEVGLRFTLGQ